MVSLKRCIVALSVVLTTFVLHAEAAEVAAATKAAGGSGAAAGGPVGSVNIYCAHAFDKLICEKLTKTATNWNQAMTMGLTEAMKHADSVIRKSKSVSLGDTGCGETYVNIQARLKECIELVNKGDNDDSINFKLSAAVTSLEDCKNALQVMKQDKTPFYVANRNFNHVLKICLAIDKTKYKKQ